MSPFTRNGCWARFLSVAFLFNRLHDPQHGALRRPVALSRKGDLAAVNGLKPTRSRLELVGLGWTQAEPSLQVLSSLIGR